MNLIITRICNFLLPLKRHLNRKSKAAFNLLLVKVYVYMTDSPSVSSIPLRVMVLDAGRVIEFDSPNKLMEEKGVFYSMAKDAGLV